MLLSFRLPVGTIPALSQLSQDRSKEDTATTYVAFIATTIACLSAAVLLFRLTKKHSQDRIKKNTTTYVAIATTITYVVIIIVVVIPAPASLVRLNIANTVSKRLLQCT